MYSPSNVENKVVDFDSPSFDLQIRTAKRPHNLNDCYKVGISS
jgi:hypothetical protein